MAKRPYEIPEGALEDKVKEKVKKFLNTHGIKFRMIVPSAYGRSTGVSDFICWRKPKAMFIGIETKANRSNTKPTENQSTFLQEIIDEGGIGVVVKCEDDILQLEQTLKERGLL